MTTYAYATAPRAFRLPAHTRIGVVRLQVGDLSRSESYYAETLGFEFHRRGGSAIVSARGGGELVHLSERRGASSVPHQGRLGLYHYAILLPSRRALGSFLTHAARNGVRVGAADHGVSEALYLRDPDGHGIEIYADRPVEEWPVHGNVLQMSTAGLDFDSVVASAEGEGWDGPPEGTRVGHIHLHVADLGEAKAFYHEALGLDIVAQMPGALFMSAGGYHHHLGTNTWAAGAPPARDDEARLIDWALVVPRRADADEAAASIGAAGYEVRRDGDDWLTADPWGTSLRITSQAP